ncbi:MAG: sortase [Parcubacteria group bacterium]
MDQKQTSHIIYRVTIALELVVLSYVATFLALNAPAYLKRAHFAASGRDLSTSLSGQYVPLETVNELAASLQTTSPGTFPYVDVVLSPSISLYPEAGAADAGQGEPDKPKIPYVDPDVFVPYTVTLPRIGVRAPLVGIDVNSESTQQQGLAQGVIHIAGTPQAGDLGNAFYAGHSSDYFFKSGQYKTVFALLPELARGDYFIITNDTRAFYFTIKETVITGPEDTSVLDRGGGQERLASLQTSYPVGTAKKRFVAIGQLTRTVDASKLKR